MPQQRWQAIGPGRMQVADVSEVVFSEFVEQDGFVEKEDGAKGLVLARFRESVFDGGVGEELGDVPAAEFRGATPNAAVLTPV